MNKLYSAVFVFTTVLAGSATAQTKTQYAGIGKKASLDPEVPVGPAIAGARSTTIWSDDFSTSGVWNIGHEGTVAQDWQIGTGLSSQGGYPTPAILSTSAGNGYAMYDSDAGNNNTGNYEYAHFTTAQSFSTSGFTNVIVEFQTQYRAFNDEQTFLQVSTNGTDWDLTLTPTSTLTAGTFYVFEPGELTQGVSPGNPVTRRINISSVAGDQPTVYLRFLFVGIWGYTWYVDDVKVLDQPAYDLVLNSGFLSHTGTGEEYCRIPADQLNPTMRVGGDFLNFGVNTMTNCAVSMDVTGGSPFNANSTATDLSTGTTGSMDQDATLPNGGMLNNGMYNATFTLTSNENAQEEDLTNNTYLRNFMVTPDYYTLDGIGNHPAGYQSLTTTGSNSFTGAEDGLIMFNYYPLRQTTTIYGIEFLLGSTTQTGSFVTCAIYDTALTAAPANLQAALYSTDVIDITVADSSAGKKLVIFDVPQVMPANGYYIGLSLFSNTGANIIRIVDDLTVPEPGLASGIQIPNDQVYTNGNAWAIRAVLNPNVGINETVLTGASLSPNPSQGILNFSAKTIGNYTIDVMDATGRIVSTTRTSGNATIDLSNEAKGVYNVRIRNASASTVQRVVLQ